MQQPQAMLPKGYGKSQAISTSGPTSNVLLERSSAGNRMMGRTLPRGIYSKLSVPGELFLKSAFASPDFAQQNKFQGIPDNIGNAIVPISLTLTSDLGPMVRSVGFDWPLTDVSQRLAIVQLPVPGMALYLAQSAPNGEWLSTNQDLRGISYDQYNALFGQKYDYKTSEVRENDYALDKFRMSTNALELVCTSNAMNWAGSLRCFRIPVVQTVTAAYDYNVNSLATGSLIGTVGLDGLQAVKSKSTPAFLSPANLGAYMVGLNIDARFTENPIIPLCANIRTGTESQAFVVRGNFPGFSELTTSVIILEGTLYKGEQTAFSVRTWQSMEAVPTFGDGSEDYSSLLPILSIPSPQLDAVALMVYKEIAERLPIAVTYAENEGFWDDVLDIIKTIGSVAGTVAQIAGFIGALV